MIGERRPAHAQRRRHAVRDAARPGRRPARRARSSPAATSASRCSTATRGRRRSSPRTSTPSARASTSRSTRCSSTSRCASSRTPGCSATPSGCGCTCITPITDFARGIRIDTDRLEELAADFDPANPEELREAMTSGALIPPKTDEQLAALARLETMLALIEGWVDVVTAEATTRLPKSGRDRRDGAPPPRRGRSGRVGVRDPRRARAAPAPPARGGRDVAGGHGCRGRRRRATPSGRTPTSFRPTRTSTTRRRSSRGSPAATPEPDDDRPARSRTCSTTTGDRPIEAASDRRADSSGDDECAPVDNSTAAHRRGRGASCCGMVLRLDPRRPARLAHPAQRAVRRRRPCVACSTTSTTARSDCSPRCGRRLAQAGYAMIADARRGSSRDDAEALLAALEPALAAARAAAPGDASRCSASGRSRRRIADARSSERRRSRDRGAAPALARRSSPTGSSTPADHGTWLRRDMPHLPVVLRRRRRRRSARSSSRASGRACTASSWHAQRCRPAPGRRSRRSCWGRAARRRSTRVTVAEVVAFAARAHPRARRARAGVRSPTARRLELAARTPADGSVSRARAGRGIRECLCAAPPGSDWAPAADPALPRCAHERASRRRARVMPDVEQAALLVDRVEAARVADRQEPLAEPDEVHRLPLEALRACRVESTTADTVGSCCAACRSSSSCDERRRASCRRPPPRRAPGARRAPPSASRTAPPPSGASCVQPSARSTSLTDLNSGSSRRRERGAAQLEHRALDDVGLVEERLVPRS